ncbi:hypothetical protein PIB30_015103 [Stylosanthes scabra]|uniref:Uncharacterized protein n=1 Tax=Stylosanthes scabra TaxID=79078 RepID=A0ABU6R778_9FABA|nr:hypothetical protein [Stylosanthes scabra]
MDDPHPSIAPAPQNKLQICNASQKKWVKLQKCPKLGAAKKNTTTAPNKKLNRLKARESYQESNGGDGIENGGLVVEKTANEGGAAAERERNRQLRSHVEPPKGVKECRRLTDDLAVGNILLRKFNKGLYFYRRHLLGYRRLGRR